MADDAAAGVPEPGGGVRRPQPLAALRVQEHLRRGHHALGDQRGDLRRHLIHLLDAHLDPIPQIRHHRLARRRPRRRYVSSDHHHPIHVSGCRKNSVLKLLPLLTFGVILDHLSYLKY
jgi:hypothetical protein